MFEREIPAMIEEYLRLAKARDIERTKRFAQQWNIDECEDKMASIETRFQKSGYDINTYL